MKISSHNQANGAQGTSNNHHKNNGDTQQFDTTVELLSADRLASASPISFEIDNLLPEFNLSDKAKLIEHSSKFDEQTSYCQSVDGTPVTQKEFALAYLKATNQVIELALNMINCGMDTRELGIEVIRLSSNTVAPPLEAPSYSGDWPILRQRYEDSIRAEIIRLAEAGPEDHELRVRAANLAMLVLGEAERQSSLKTLLNNGGKEQIDQQASIMSEAIARSGEKASDPLVVLENFCKVAHEKTNSFPSLELVLDFDGDLTRTPKSGVQWKPGELTNVEIINAIDELCDLPPFLRLVMTECPGLDPERNSLTEALYEIAGHESEWFADSQQLIRRLKDFGINNVVLSGNHSRVVEKKIESDGMSVGAIEGLSPSNWYSDKFSLVLHRFLTETKASTSERLKPRIVLYCDDQEEHVCDAIDNGGVASAGNIFFFATADGTRLQQLLADREIPCVVNTVASNGRGSESTFRFVEQYLQLRELSRDHRIPAKVYEDSYVQGDVLRECYSHVDKHSLMPQPALRTILKPVRNEDLVKEGNQYLQYDLGCPAAYVDKSGEMVVMYKAANGPSKSNSNGRPINPVSMSNVFGARVNPRSGQVQFFDVSGRADVNPMTVGPLLQPNEQLSADDGVHDPRITRVEPYNTSFITAVAFDKTARTSDMVAAKGALSRPIRGAKTMLYTAEDISDPRSYKFEGQLGPDRYCKNMVFLEEPRDNDTMLMCIRMMPGIQIIPIGRDIVEKITKDPLARTKFWDEMLTPDSIQHHTVLTPRLVHEGFDNPHAPERAGQLAPSFAPVKVTLDNTPWGQKSFYLMIYNSVPDFKEDIKDPAHGRVINAALLDYDNPWDVVSVAPLPVVLPRSENDFVQAEGITGRNYNVAFAAGGGISESGKLVVVYTEHDSIVRTAEWESAKDLASYLLQFDSAGSTRWSL